MKPNRHEQQPFMGREEDLLTFGRIRDCPFVPEYALNALESSPWGKHTFACCLTHDIDHVRKYDSVIHWGRRMVADVLYRGSVRMLMRRFREGMAEMCGRDTFRRDFKWLLDTEKELSITASYFFPTAERSKHDSGYTLSEVAELVHEVELGGMEAGLHLGYDAYLDCGRMREEKERFDSIVTNKCYGVRHHCLRCIFPDTWRIHAELGFLYDCSYGYAEHEGFRGGTCYPFRPIEPNTREEMDVWEIPLVVMDVSLKKYRQMTPEEGLQAMKILVAEVRRVHGVFCLLWHNSSLNEADWRGWRDVYRRILDFVLEAGGWVASGREILEKWQETQVRIVKIPREYE